VVKTAKKKPIESESDPCLLPLNQGYKAAFFSFRAEELIFFKKTQDNSGGKDLLFDAN
jgi:hypothetical protein